MDLPLIGPGATVYLPVYCDGALLMLGDIHGAQGHGEIIGGAIETSGKIACTIDVIKNQSTQCVRIGDQSTLGAVGVDGDLRAAVQQAYANLIDWLVDEETLNRFDTYNLVSQCAQVTLGNIVTNTHVAAAHIARDALPG